VGKRRGNRVADAALAALVVGYAALTLAIALLNPPWEAPDETYHVQNVETLLDGHWYRIEPGAGLEPHQPPLYYLLLAGVQEASGHGARAVHPPIPVGFFCVTPYGRPVFDISATLHIPMGQALSTAFLTCAFYRHNLPRARGDERLVHLLRLPSVLFGIGVLLLTAAVARRVSDDDWTPVVAAGVVAGVPAYAFTNAIVNNDGAVVFLAAVLLLLAVVFVERAPSLTRRRQDAAAVTFGALLGLLLLTKLYGLVLVIAIVVTLWVATRHVADRTALRWRLSAIVTITFVVLVGWWLVQNERWYGDPLALTRSHDYLLPISGLGAPRDYGAAKILLVDVRTRLADTFFYPSVLGRVLWVVLVAALGCLALPGARRRRPQLLVLASFVLAALVAVAIVALQTATFRSSTAYIGLPALAVLAALGIERLPVPVAVRLLVPVGMFAATIATYQHDLVGLATH
jgi:hypothetical protein